MAGMLGRFTPQAFALLRIISGLMFAVHGTQKLFNFPPGGMGTPPLASMGGVSAIIELVGGLMIAFGIFASYAAFIASGEMAVAYFLVHAAKGGFWPIVNKGELAALYCFVFLYIAAHGPGIWSVTKK
jgi:putative oxidoreductase